MRSLPLLILFLLTGCTPDEPAVTAETATHTVPKWQKLRLDFTGPQTSETADENPFTDYRLDVNFTHNDSVFTVPGYYAADGNAAETGADAGNVWRVNFRPSQEGAWHYEAVMRKGINVVNNDDQAQGERVEVGGQTGTIFVNPPAAGETGRLARSHPRYLQWAESGDYFLKGGADSPENLLAFEDFDGTYRHSNEFRDGESKTEGLHHYTAHLGDWKSGDPTWQDGKGKGLIGALNYLNGVGVNSFYALTMNINGDGKDVWPFVAHDDYTRYDCSKLDQWEVVFDHADDHLGMMLHLVMQETENETLLDNGDTGPNRKLYFRELVARFGHHRAVTWNMGEENGPNKWSKETGFQTNAQQAACAAWFAANDPYHNYVSVHTHPNEREMREIIDPLLGDANFGGLALQVHHPRISHDMTKYWLDASAAAGAPWIATIDEIGPWFRGLDPDNRAPFNNQDSLRALTLWGNLMAGGAGVEWYFGARNAHNDLGMEDWRSRDRAWKWTSATLDFFREHVPFQDMESHDELVTDGIFCLANPGETYLIYLPFGGETTLDLSDSPGGWQMRWVEGVSGAVAGAAELAGGVVVPLKAPEAGDWAVLVTKGE